MLQCSCDRCPVLPKDGPLLKEAGDLARLLPEKEQMNVQVHAGAQPTGKELCRKGPGSSHEH